VAISVEFYRITYSPPLGALRIAQIDDARPNLVSTMQRRASRLQQRHEVLVVEHDRGRGAADEEGSMSLVRPASNDAAHILSGSDVRG
jgi:hypothetical protein